MNYFAFEMSYYEIFFSHFVSAFNVASSKLAHSNMDPKQDILISLAEIELIDHRVNSSGPVGLLFTLNVSIVSRKVRLCSLCRKEL